MLDNFSDGYFVNCKGGTYIFRFGIDILWTL